MTIDSFRDRAELVNVYGPTECTCICSAYRVTEDDFNNFDGYPPLGKQIPNFSITILNEQREASSSEEDRNLLKTRYC